MVAPGASALLRSPAAGAFTGATGIGKGALTVAPRAALFASTARPSYSPASHSRRLYRCPGPHVPSGPTRRLGAGTRVTCPHGAFESRGPAGRGEAGCAHRGGHPVRARRADQGPGLVPNVTRALARLNADLRAFLAGEHGGGKALYRGEKVLWNRDYSARSPADLAADPRACAELAETLDRLPGGVWRMVVGHSVQKAGVVTSACGGAVWRVDVGMSRGVLGSRPQALEILPGGRVAVLSAPAAPGPVDLRGRVRGGGGGGGGGGVWGAGGAVGRAGVGRGVPARGGAGKRAAAGVTRPGASRPCRQRKRKAARRAQPAQAGPARRAPSTIDQRKARARPRAQQRAAGL